MNITLTKEEQIKILEKDRKVFADQADIAYKYRDFKLEDKWQIKIDKITEFINTLKKYIDFEKYPNLNIDKMTEELEDTHNWDSYELECRCSGCSMKRETFYSKMEGLRIYYVNKDPFGFFIESSRCPKKFD